MSIAMSLYLLTQGGLHLTQRDMLNTSHSASSACHHTVCPRCCCQHFGLDNVYPLVHRHQLRFQSQPELVWGCSDIVGIYLARA